MESERLAKNADKYSFVIRWKGLSICRISLSLLFLLSPRKTIISKLELLDVGNRESPLLFDFTSFPFKPVAKLSRVKSSSSDRSTLRIPRHTPSLDHSTFYSSSFAGFYRSSSSVFRWNVSMPRTKLFPPESALYLISPSFSLLLLPPLPPPRPISPLNGI